MLNVKVDLVRDLGALSSLGRLSQEQEGCCKDEKGGNDNTLEVRHGDQHMIDC